MRKTYKDLAKEERRERFYNYFKTTLMCLLIFSIWSLTYVISDGVRNDKILVIDK